VRRDDLSYHACSLPLRAPPHDDGGGGGGGGGGDGTGGGDDDDNNNNGGGVVDATSLLNDLFPLDTLATEGPISEVMLWLGVRTGTATVTFICLLFCAAP
jgi:hypothetical protein